MQYASIASCESTFTILISHVITTQELQYLFGHPIDHYSLIPSIVPTVELNGLGDISVSITAKVTMFLPLRDNVIINKEIFLIM